MRQLLRDWSHPAHCSLMVRESTLDQIESRLGLKIPDDYRAAICEYGVPRICPSLGSAMRSAGPGWQLAELYNPEFISDLALELQWEGLCDDLLPIGQDAEGYVICLCGGPTDSYSENESFVKAYDPANGSLWDLCPTFTDFLQIIANMTPRTRH